MLNNVLKTTINNEIFMGKLLQRSFNFQIIVSWKKRKKEEKESSLSKKFKKKE